MLKFLAIRHFAVIDRLQVEFQPGLTLLTGETGSGKSIIVDALGLLLGDRASQEKIRTGEETAAVEGQFAISLDNPVRQILHQGGFEAGEELILKREISGSGRNRIFVQGSLGTLNLLRELAPYLVHIHGQNENQTLTRPESHLDLLDEFGGNGEMRSRVVERCQLFRALERRLQMLQQGEQERLRRADLLKFQANEIEKVGPKPREDEELQAERRLLQNAEKLFSCAAEAYGLLYGDEGSHGMLAAYTHFLRRVEELSQMDPRFQGYLSNLDDVRYALEDLATTLRDYQQSVDFSPERLEQVERRLAEIERLKKKYGATLDAVLGHLERAKAELVELEGEGWDEGALRKQLEESRREYIQAAEALSVRRRQMAQRLEASMREELSELALEKAVFQVQFRSLSEPAPRGTDEVEFLVTTNPGEDLRPLVKIASGGEMSRISLALKSIIAADHSDAALIFDEVDAGIGGRVAETVGRKLKRLAARRQVLCVTHLPQIACFADHHYAVSKKVRKGRTITCVDALLPNARVEEIARMLGGSRITETTHKHARELLRLSKSP
ncbi:MAG: DNA repair protein RecN [Acidobacteria bacterium]|nr:DNA repair protein RecN [Acidobacteriota bacterium]